MYLKKHTQSVCHPEGNTQREHQVTELLAHTEVSNLAPSVLWLAKHARQREWEDISLLFINANKWLSLPRTEQRIKSKNTVSYILEELSLNAPFYQGLHLGDTFYLCFSASFPGVHKEVDICSVLERNSQEKARPPSPSVLKIHCTNQGKGWKKRELVFELLVCQVLNVCTYVLWELFSLCMRKLRQRRLNKFPKLMNGSQFKLRNLSWLLEGKGE